MGISLLYLHLASSFHALCYLLFFALSVNDGEKSLFLRTISVFKLEQPNGADRSGLSVH